MRTGTLVVSILYLYSISCNNVTAKNGGKTPERPTGAESILKRDIGHVKSLLVFAEAKELTNRMLEQWHRTGREFNNKGTFFYAEYIARPPISLRSNRFVLLLYLIY